MAWTARERELREAGIPLRSDASVAAGAISGAAAGLSAGAFAGAPGLVIGAVLGGAVGVVAGRAIEVHTAQEDAVQDELDHQICIIDGDMWARDSEFPPPPHDADPFGPRQR